MGLYDGAMIKDNHISALGGVRKAVETVRGSISHMVKIEVEVDTLAHLDEALCHRVDAVMLDNMTLDDLRQAVAMVGGGPTRICSTVRPLSRPVLGQCAPSPWKAMKTPSAPGYTAGAVRIGRSETVSTASAPPIPRRLFWSRR